MFLETLYIYYTPLRENLALVKLTAIWSNAMINKAEATSHLSRDMFRQLRNSIFYAYLSFSPICNSVRQRFALVSSIHTNVNNKALHLFSLSTQKNISLSFIRSQIPKHNCRCSCQALRIKCKYH